MRRSNSSIQPEIWLLCEILGERRRPLPPRGSPPNATGRITEFFPLSVTQRHGPPGLSFEQAHDLRPGQSIEMQIEADDRRRGVRLHVKLVGLYGKHRE